jgi:hypothetical protein
VWGDGLLESYVGDFESLIEVSVHSHNVYIYERLEVPVPGSQGNEHVFQLRAVQSMQLRFGF